MEAEADNQDYLAQAEQEDSPQFIRNLPPMVDEGRGPSLPYTLAKPLYSLPQTTTASKATKQWVAGSRKSVGRRNPMNNATETHDVASWARNWDPVELNFGDFPERESLTGSKNKDFSSRKASYQFLHQKKPIHRKDTIETPPHQAHSSDEVAAPQLPILNRGRPYEPGDVVTRAVADILAEQFVRQLESVYPSLPVRLGHLVDQEAYLSRIEQSLATYLCHDDAILGQMPPYLWLVLECSMLYLAQYIVRNPKQLPWNGAATEKDGLRRRYAGTPNVKIIGYSRDDYDEPTATTSRTEFASRITEKSKSAFSLPFKAALHDKAAPVETMLYHMITNSAPSSINELHQYHDLALALAESLSETFSSLPKLPQFRDLAHECHVTWYQATSARLMKEGFVSIAQWISNIGPGPQLLTLIRVDWDPFPVMKQLQEIGECCSLSNVLTITGNLHVSYAASCEDYIAQTWPNVGPRLLHQLDEAIKKAWERHCSRPQGAVTSPLKSETQLNEPLNRAYKISFKGPVAEITLQGDASDFEPILQILSWLSAALGVPDHDDGPEIVDVAVVETLGLHKIVTESQKLKVDGSRHCWTKLLDRAVVAQGFPIPDRGLGRGLEISLRTACRLIGATKAIDCVGGPVIRGLSGTMIPVRSIEQGIQWHLLVRDPSRPMRSTLQDLKDFPNRLTHDKAAPEIMDAIFASLEDPAARCFIGWHPKAASFAGADTSAVDYSAIRKSSLKPPGKRFQLRNFTLGFQQIVTAEVEVGATPIQSTLYLRRTHHWLDDLLIQAAGGRVLLYDVPTQRGWLHRTDEVVLHLLRYQTLPHHGVKLETYDSVEKTLKENSGQTVQRGLTIQDIIVDKLEVIERLQAELSNLEKDRAFSTKLFGFDFLQCANRSGSFVLRETTLSGMPMLRSWVHFIHASETPVLFGGGFGELIRLSEMEQKRTCFMWRKVPCNMHLMAATAQTMRQIYAEEPGPGNEECRSLTYLKLLWDQGSSMLQESCQEPHSHCCCQRVQMLRTRGLLRSKPVQGPSSLPETGAIIFGNPDTVKSALKSPKTATMWQKSVVSKDRKQFPAGVLAVTEDEVARGLRELTQIEEHMKQITT